MKKLLFAAFAAALFVSSVSYAGVPDPTVPGIKKREVGARQSEPIRVFKLVRFPRLTSGVNTAALASGDVVVYDTVSDDGISVCTTTSSHDNAVAGICVTTIQTIDIAAGGIAADQEGYRNWGWIIVHGPAFAKTTLGAGSGVVANDMWITSTDAGAVGYVTSGQVNGIHYQGAGGFFFDTGSATDTQEKVFVRLE